MKVLHFKPVKVSFAMFKMTKFKPRKLDLMKFESDNITKYCMLSVMVGLIADIDLESEKLRSGNCYTSKEYLLVYPQILFKSLIQHQRPIKQKIYCVPYTHRYEQCRQGLPCYGI